MTSLSWLSDITIYYFENKSKDVLFSLGGCVVITHTLIVAITRLQFLEASVALI